MASGIRMQTLFTEIAESITAQLHKMCSPLERGIIRMRWLFMQIDLYENCATSRFVRLP